MPAKDFEQEKQWLKQVYEELDQQLSAGQERAAAFREEMLKIRTSLWEDYGISSASPHQLMDVAQQINELRQRSGYFGIARKQLQQLRAMEKNPYFGRMDFHEEGLPSRETMYIGIRSLIQQDTGLPMVYDWRAPVSSMFYDYGLGEAEYEGPGGVYRGEIFLKRQYRIKDRELLYMFDNELKIDDEVLQEALGQSASEKMRTIVNTIQREQNKAIRNDRDGLLLVEGPAGSGKTSVALHRIAYLLYKYRDSINSENIIIFSPNRIFGDYISHVLPELGEENVDQTTFQDFAETTLNWEWDLETMASFLEEILQSDGSIRAAKLENTAFKSSPQLQMILDNLVDWVTERALDFFDVRLNGKLIISGAEQKKLFVDNYNYLPINKRLERIHDRILFLLRPFKKKRQQEVLATVKENPHLEGESWLTQAREAVGSVNEELKPLLTRLAEHLQLDSIHWYQRLWEDQGFWQEITNGLEYNEEYKKSLASLREGIIAFEDLAPLLYLKGELEGYPVKREIRHVVIDEVQDYSPMQLHILTKTYPRAKFTLVGDVFQSLNPYVWEGGQRELAQVFPALAMGNVKLTKSYRSTREIFNFCSALLEGESPGETVLRDGKKPLLRKVGSKKRFQVLEQELKIKLASDYQTIAVICRTAEECATVYSELKEIDALLPLTLLTHEKATFRQGIVIVPVYLAKGLEFDAVLIPEANQAAYGEEFARRLLYVACSRALHDLTILYTAELSPFITPLPGTLYQTKK